MHESVQRIYRIDATWLSTELAGYCARYWRNPSGPGRHSYEHIDLVFQDAPDHIWELFKEEILSGIPDDEQQIYMYFS